MQSDPNAPETASQTAAQAARKCRKHNLQLAPDGLCALCRRERDATAQESSGPSFIGTVVFGMVAQIGVSVVSYWYTHPEKMPWQSAPRKEHKGPPIEDQIAAVDDQLKTLRSMQRAGELSGAGLQQISQLEKKRALLVAVYEAQKDNE
jgi:hypothetical protein